MADNAEQLEAEIAETDARWHTMRARFLVPGQDGPKEPDGGNIAASVATMVVSVVAMAFFSASSLHPVFVYASLVPFSIATFRLLGRAGKAEAFERHKTAYETTRASLVARLNKIRSGQP